MLSGLIQQFDRLASDLVLAVRREADDQVHEIDARLQILVQRIFNSRAQNRGEISAQINFFHRLAVKSSEDGSSVRSYTDKMTSLFERYLDQGADLKLAPSGPEQTPLPDGYDPSLHEMLLDSLLDRVAVVGLDYHYIYCNKRNADFHEKLPSDFVGKHILEFLDLERFRTRAKPRLDQCFGGAKVSYKYEISDAGGRMFEVDCLMTPFVGPENSIAGAVIVLVMQPMYAKRVRSQPAV